MEQGQYCWMQATNKKKLFSMASNHHLITLPQKTTNNNPSYDDELSWEEQAFAEDAAAGSLGGCIWPPRSYSCSFCRREFRSAQALGGHMNVHRRDRARLKQQPSSPKNSNNEAAEILSNNPFTSLGSYNLLYPPPPPVCGFACNNNKANPNSDLDVIASTSSSPSPNSNPLLLAPPSSSSSVNKGPICNSSSIVHNKTYPLSLYSCESSWSTLGEDHHHRLCSNKFYPEATTANCELFNSHPRPLSSNIVAKKKFYPESDDLEKASKGLLDSRCRGKGNDDNNNEDGGDNDDDGEMAVSLNLVICRTHKPLPFETKEEDENHIHCKRRKLDSSSSIQLFLPKSSSSSVVDHHQVQPKVFELSPSSIEEELDLELRLGNKSKV